MKNEENSRKKDLIVLVVRPLNNNSKQILIKKISQILEKE